MNTKFKICTLAVGVSIALAIPVGAQTPDKKPAAKPASVRATMSRDELRSCMKLQADTKERVAALEVAKASLEQDRVQVDEAQKQIAHLRSEVDKYRDGVREAEAAVRVNAVKVEEWNAEMEEVEKSQMRAAEKRKKDMKVERVAIEARGKALVSTRDAQFKMYEAAVAKINSQAKDIEAVINGWNKRNSALADEAATAGEMRDEYAADCANRRFREEDEAAIKKGK